MLTQVGTIGWYYCQPLAHTYFLQLQHSIKDENDLITISIDKKKLTALKNEEGEIVIDGVLYDVEKSVSKENAVELQLKKDRKETQWNNHYITINKLLHKQPSGKAPAAAGKAPNLFFPFFYSKESGKDPWLVKDHAKEYLNLSINYYSCPVIGLVTPPPQV